MGRDEVAAPGPLRVNAVRVSAFALAVWLAVAVLAAAALVAERRHVIERAKGYAGALSLVVEEHTARTFRAVDLVLAAVSGALVLAPVPRHDARFREMLRGRLEALPYLRAMYIIGPDGRWPSRPPT